MCCLKYEQSTYEQTIKRVPRVGKDIVTPDGVGVLTEINAIRERVKVRLRVDEEDNFEVREYAMDEVRKPGPNDAPAARQQPRQDRKPQGKRTPIPTESAEEPQEEEQKRRRYPHQKAPKNLSTDQFLEKMKEGAGEKGEAQGKDQAKEPHREHRRRRRGGRGRHRAEGAKDAGAQGDSAPAKSE